MEPPKTIPFSATASPPKTVPFAAAPAPAPKEGMKVFGNPVEDVKQAGKDVFEAIAGEGRFAGKNPLTRGFRAAEAAFNAVPTVAADVIPGGRAVLDTASQVFGAGINAAGNISNYLADAAQKIGLMTPEMRARFDENNAAFADSPLGYAFEAGAEVGESSGNISNVILGAHGTAQTAQAILDHGIPAITKAIEEHKAATAAKPPPMPPEVIRLKADALKDAETIRAIEDKYSSTRNFSSYEKDGGTASRERIATTGVLRYATNENGLIRTREPGGAVDQYRAMTVTPAESAVRTLLEREGTMVNVTEVEKYLMDAVERSTLRGADKLKAQQSIKNEIEGLKLDADQNGYIQTASIHDAKVNAYNNTNYLTPPEEQVYRKAVGDGYKRAVENNSRESVAAINAELDKFYGDIERLKLLDGRIVETGKIGKYLSQASGATIGALIGSVFGGPIGAALGTAAGSELARVIKSKSFQGTFKQGELQAPDSPVLDNAILKVNEGGKPPALPPPRPIIPDVGPFPDRPPF
jgi:hypothetical protein